MKSTVSPHMAAFLILGTIAPLSAQNLSSTIDSPRFAKATELSGDFDIPAFEKAQGLPAAEARVFTSQDALTLDEKKDATRDVDTVIDLTVLGNPSPYRKVAVSTRSQPYEVATDSLQKGLAEISAMYREAGTPQMSSDCTSIGLSIQHRIKLDPSKVLEYVELEVATNPACACEIVKSAIMASDADTAEVVAIVETAITVAPESMRIISQCAIAAIPDSITGVQALLARLDPNAGDSGYSAKSAKDSKDAKVASIINPPEIRWTSARQPAALPPIFPPPVTEVNP